MCALELSLNGDDLAVRTPFAPGLSLVQVLRGMENTNSPRNKPVDFRLAGLQPAGHTDIWHVDQVLSFSTDECVPMVIGGEDIGGNHGYPCGVSVLVPGHGMDVRDVGTLWRDESGLQWTLMRVESPDRLLLLSHNAGATSFEWRFAAGVSGALACLDDDAPHPQTLRPVQQTGHVQLTPAIRRTRLEITCVREGRRERLAGSAAGCDAVEIDEAYEIINPASAACALRAGRPRSGYASQPSLAVGDAMFLHRMIYRIDAEGTILCAFDHRLLQPVAIGAYMGIMHQERCDAYGGGVWRYIPGLRPVEADGLRLDFSRPYDTTHGPMPRNLALTPETWARPDAPPDRQLDLLCRPDGSCAAAFASGYLPCFDGAPDKRRALCDAGHIVSSRKTYPTFSNGAASFRGVAYKKFFRPTQCGASAYTVNHGDDTYLYMDVFAPGACARHAIPSGAAVSVLNLSGISWREENGVLCARGEQGHAAFRLAAPHAKERG